MTVDKSWKLNILVTWLDLMEILESEFLANLFWNIDIELGEICDDDDDEREAGNFETVDAESAIEFFSFFLSKQVSQVTHEPEIASQIAHEPQIASQIAHEPEVITIEHQSIIDLKQKFSSEVEKIENKCFIISNLNKYSRKVLHSKCEALKLFHWSKKIIENTSNL